METKAVVIEITKSEEFGKVGKIVAEVASYYLADAMTTGMDRMRFRGEMKGASGHIGYIACKASYIRSAESSYGFVLKD
jgi:hypothetical protein